MNASKSSSFFQALNHDDQKLNKSQLDNSSVLLKFQDVDIEELYDNEMENYLLKLKHSGNSDMNINYTSIKKEIKKTVKNNLKTKFRRSLQETRDKRI
jgi:hypothetical protein